MNFMRSRLNLRPCFLDPKWVALTGGVPERAVGSLCPAALSMKAPNSEWPRPFRHLATILTWQLGRLRRGLPIGGLVHGLRARPSCVLRTWTWYPAATRS